jgi:hypothetical protein
MDENKRDEFDEATQDETFELDDLDEADEAPHPRLNADFLLDKVIPDEIDWRDLVRRHPFVTVGAAATVGFLLGRARGSAIVAGLSAGLTTAVMRQLSDVFEGEVFEF